MRFYFDFISPYAYLAWTQIHTIAQRHGREVEPVPVLFAGLLNHHGQKGPAEIEAKRTWVFEDTLRMALRFGVPLSPPPTHPFNPLLALRTVLAVPEAKRRALVDALFAATWGDAAKKGLERPEVIAGCVADLGLDRGATVTRATSPAVKDALRQNTEDAIAAGVFGVPTVVVDGWRFWGADRLDDLERRLAGDDPVTAEAMAAARALKPSAKR